METSDHKTGEIELFVCPTDWYSETDGQGKIAYPSNPKQFIKQQSNLNAIPNKTWANEEARILCRYNDYKSAVEGMTRLENGTTSDEQHYNRKENRKANAKRGMKIV